MDRGRRFITHDVWRIGRPGEPVPHGFIIKQIRVVILLVQGLVRDALLLRAAALTFTTVLSIVPFLAITFYIIQSFDLGEQVYDMLSSRLAGRHGLARPADHPDPNRALQQDIIGLVFQGVPQRETTADGETLQDPRTLLVEYINRTAKPGAIGIVGMLFVLTTSLGLMMNIESSFNSIWGLTRTRSWYRMFSDYVMILLVLPFVVAGVLGATRLLQARLAASPWTALKFGLSVFHHAVIWLAFSALYFIVPNTRVRFRYALLAGVVSGTLWSITAWAHITFQIGLANYSMIYSGFALFPLFLMWLYVSWIIVLFGAELTFACQNEKTFAMERLAAGASYAYREALGLAAMIEMGRRFDTGDPGLEATQSAEAWNVPTRLVNETLDELERAGLVRRCATDPPTYLPARSIGRITVADVIKALREAGRDPSALREDHVLRPLLDAIWKEGERILSASIADVLQRLKSPGLDARIQQEDGPPAGQAVSQT